MIVSSNLTDGIMRYEENNNVKLLNPMDMTPKLVFPKKNSVDFICIDPGQNIGLAIFQGETTPINTLVFKGTLGDWEFKLRFANWKFDEFLKTIPKIDNKTPAYIEMPAFQETDKGLVCARGGSLYKLIKAFVLQSYILEKNHFKVIEVPIVRWKGQLDKKKVDIRIKRIINQEYPEHASDAVGIGLWVKGFMGSQKNAKI